MLAKLKVHLLPRKCQSRPALHLVLAAFMALPSALDSSSCGYDWRFEPAEIESAPADSLAKTIWRGVNPYQELLRRHNRFLPEFHRWRSLFATHASELARLVKTLPGSEKLSEWELRQLFRNLETVQPVSVPGDVFEAWADHWTGLWSNGVPQYHVWASARPVAGQWVQPVTLSEAGFVEMSRIAAQPPDRMDLGINVFSPANGITGWVSKRQHGCFELPHIGYLVNASTLVWICRRCKSDRDTADSCWFVFLESVQRSVQPAEYRIAGLRFKIDKQGLLAVDGPEDHCATYFSGPS